MTKTALAMMEPKPEDWRRVVPVWVMLELNRIMPKWRDEFQWIAFFEQTRGNPYVHVGLGEYIMFLVKE